MGTLVLIAGPNRSGKSRFAETLAARARGPRYYLATMRPCTPDNLVRIRAHRKQRRGLGFQTLECPCRVGEVPLDPDSVVLLEDVSNLLANVLFEQGGTAGQVLRDIRRLQGRCRLLLAVTISGLSPHGLGGETADYVRALNALNQALWDGADGAVTMENQVPVWEKGGPYAVF